MVTAFGPSLSYASIPFESTEDSSSNDGVADIISPNPMGLVPVATPAPGTRGDSFIQHDRLCRGFLGIVRHDWLYLTPSEEQVEQVRQLLSFGKGTYGRMGARREFIFDRVCRACFRAESRMNAYIAALKQARGVK
jgi:hypothetical protein